MNNNVLKHISEDYNVVFACVVDANIRRLNSIVKQSRKDYYGPTDRLVFFIPEEKYEISDYGDHLSRIQEALNIADISNCFVIIVSNSANIAQEIIDVTRVISYDPTPMNYFKDNKIVSGHPLQKKTLHCHDKYNFPNSDAFCVFPWIGIVITRDGKFQVCCGSNDTIGNFNIHEHSLNEVLDSDYMMNLRQQFVQGKKPIACSKCWDDEQNGKPSKRSDTLDSVVTYEDILLGSRWTKEKNQLHILDLKYHEKVNWDEYLNGHLDHVRVIEFRGHGNIDIIKKIIQLGIASDVKIVYNRVESLSDEEKSLWIYFKEIIGAKP